MTLSRTSQQRHDLANNEIEQVVENAVNSQQQIMNWDDEKINNMLADIALFFSNNLVYFAEREVEVTGIGNTEDKKHKLSLVSNVIASELIATKTQGRLRQITPYTVEYASSLGVIFGLIPMTNPVPNSLFKTLLTLKTRNALIVSYPRAAVGLGQECVDKIQSILKKHGAPQHLTQSVPVPSSRERSALFMSHEKVDLILATGGSDLVKSAYRSGTAAYGVGPGNVPVIVTACADLHQAAQDIIKGKSYDNGIVCGSESNLIVSDEVKYPFTTALEENGGAVLTREEAKRVKKQIFDQSTKKLRREFIGLDGKTIAQQACVFRSWNIKVLIIPIEENELAWFGKEKMAPVLTLLFVDENQSISMAKRMLLEDGAGHTAVIHSSNKKRIEEYAQAIPVGRMLVNTPATHGMLGVTTLIPKTFMAGCGSWGGNISTEGITWRHLVNIKTLAYNVNKIVPA